MMEPMLEIPKDRKRTNALKLCLGIAFVALVLLAVVPQLSGF